MSITTAISQLLEVVEIRSEASPAAAAYTSKTVAIGLARVGDDTQTIIAGTLEELAKVDFGGPLHSLVIPGTMHFLEADVVRGFAVNKATFNEYAEVEQH